MDVQIFQSVKNHFLKKFQGKNHTSLIKNMPKHKEPNILQCGVIVLVKKLIYKLKGGKKDE